MRRSDIVSLCRSNLFRRRSRTLLTVLGVTIGCCAIVIMVSLGIGMRASQQKALEEMGDLTVITVSAPQAGHGKAKLDDAAVKEFSKISGVKAAVPKLDLGTYTLKLYAGSSQRYVADWTTVAGIDFANFEKVGYRMVEGAVPATAPSGSSSAVNSSTSITESMKPITVVAGQYLAYNFKDTLKPEGANTVDRYGLSSSIVSSATATAPPAPFFNPMEQPLTLEVDNGTSKFKVPLKVIGTTAEDYSKGMETSDGAIMSLSDLRKIIEKAQGANRKAIPYANVLVKVSDIASVEKVESQIKALGYNTESMESIRKPMERDAQQKQLMLGGLGAISLLVAALGITNTMIMSISERIREIGVMKALGCYVADIRLLFLSEAGAIGLIGGLAGCVISFFVSIILNLASSGSSITSGASFDSTLGATAFSTASAAPPFSPETLWAVIIGSDGINRLSIIPWWLYLFAIAFSVLIGLGSGYYPASKAVRVSVLEALRNE